MAWARAMTTSWQDVSSDRPHTTRTTPSTHTLSSIRDQTGWGEREDSIQSRSLQITSVDSMTLHGTDSKRQEQRNMLVMCRYDG